MMTPSVLPDHLAIIMDGNGRFALRHKKPRIYGHKLGVDAVVKTLKSVLALGIRELSLFAFSIENQQRPVVEVDSLMWLLEDSIHQFEHKLIDASIQLNIFGQQHFFSESLQKLMARLVDKTCTGSALKLNVFINYSGQWHITQAAQHFARKAHESLTPLVPSEAEVRHYFEHNLAPVDLLIRTGHVARVSNFLLWHLSYAELHWAHCYWPEFDRKHLDAALLAYAQAKRRFGLLEHATQPLDPEVKVN
jgi:undecaprenyl diphosphate synthase